MKRPNWFWLFCVIGALCAATAYTQSAKKRSLKEQIEDLIRRAVAEQATNPAASAKSPVQSLYDGLEQQYLNGEITARQFMRIMEELQLYRRTNANPQALTALPPQVRTPSVPSTATNSRPAIETNTPPEESVTFGDIERKLDELLRRKEAMDRAAATNTIPETEPKTKREKLDRLLRLLITDKITKQEYEQRREKVMAEPDTP